MKFTKIALLYVSCQSVFASHHVLGHSHDRRHLVQRQNFFESLASKAGDMFGGGRDEDRTTTSARQRTLTAGPVTRPDDETESTTRSLRGSRSTRTTTSEEDEPTSTITSSSTTSSESSETTTESSTESTTSVQPSPTITPPPASPPINTQPSPTSTRQASSGISSAGIAVAVIFSLIIVAIIIYLLFRYNPRLHAWWVARQERAFKERTYRDALDGPMGRNKSHTHGDGMDTEHDAGVYGDRRKSRIANIASFFAPKTVNLGGGKEIRRKPVNWGAGANNNVHGQGADEKIPVPSPVPLAMMASPMGRSGTTSSTASSSTFVSTAGLGIGGMGGVHNGPKSSFANKNKELPKPRVSMYELPG